MHSRTYIKRVADKRITTWCTFEKKDFTDFMTASFKGINCDLLHENLNSEGHFMLKTKRIKVFIKLFF